MWGFGSFLGMFMLMQVLSGLLLACYYVSGELGWSSVISITREVSSGWVLRLFHSNSASFIFMILFIHYFRSLMQASFFLKYPWVSGWAIKALIMASAFLGYVLPWGQMSFWGATVIINLLSILPMGSMLVAWLWGGFYVSSFTCSFFYALHFLIPLIVMLLVGLHLLFLHNTGSSVPGGMSRFSGMMTKFSYLFIYKDVVNISFMWMMFMLMLVRPDWSSDPVNFMPSDMSNSPIHIQPEWYFLHLYAILRSIPNKLGGLIGFFLALFMLLLLSIMKSHHHLNCFSFYNYMVWSFLFINILLLWLGMQPVEDPYIWMGQIETMGYFLFLFSVIALDFLLL